MSQSMTFTPACASVVAIPKPMPEAAPVTNAVFPANSFMQVFPVLFLFEGGLRAGEGSV